MSTFFPSINYQEEQQITFRLTIDARGDVVFQVVDKNVPTSEHLPPILQTMKQTLLSLNYTLFNIPYRISLPDSKDKWLGDVAVDTLMYFLSHSYAESKAITQTADVWFRVLTPHENSNKMGRNNTLPIVFVILEGHHFTLYIREAENTYRWYDPMECGRGFSMTIKPPTQNMTVSQWYGIIKQSLPITEEDLDLHPSSNQPCFTQEDTFMCGYFVLFKFADIIRKYWDTSSKVACQASVKQYVQDNMKQCLIVDNNRSYEETRQLIEQWVITMINDIRQFDTEITFKETNLPQQNNLLQTIKTKTETLFQTFSTR